MDMTDMTIKDWGRDQENEFQWEKKGDTPSDTPLDFVGLLLRQSLLGHKESR